jgi:hypothetical protein
VQVLSFAEDGNATIASAAARRLRHGSPDDRAWKDEGASAVEHVIAGADGRLCINMLKGALSSAYRCFAWVGMRGNLQQGEMRVEP